MRERICLNGEWDFKPLYGRRGDTSLPEDITFEEKILVPSTWRSKFDAVWDIKGHKPYKYFDYPEEWEQAEVGVLRRFFTVPQEMRGKRVFLNCEAMAQLSGIYINGEKVTEWEEMYLPLLLDITDYIKDGENELCVVCSEFEHIQVASGDEKLLGLMGSWFGYICRGIWQDIYLECREAVYLDDIKIDTFYRDKKIDLTIVVKNTTAQEVSAQLAFDITFEGKSVKTVPGISVAVPAGGEAKVTVSEPWENPALWNLDTPNLHFLNAQLSVDGTVTDTVSERFGFKEVWAENDKFYVNGIHVNFRGDSWHFQGAMQQTKEYALNWFKLCREKGVNIVRLHAEPHPTYYLDAADEVGIFIVDETAIYGSSGKTPADNEVYLDRCRRHVMRLMRRDKNHPSIVIWSLMNEMRWVYGRDEFKLHIPAMMDLMRTYDTTRRILLEGDNRLISKENTEIYSYHYNIDGTERQWLRDKPLIYGEHGGMWYICPQNASAYYGLSCYTSWEDCVRGIQIKEKLFLEYSRRVGVSGLSTFNFAHYFQTAMPDEDIVFDYDDYTTPGIKPKYIRKYAMTINNGNLKDYPQYIPNPAMDIMHECFREVTVIEDEYDTSFYDDAPLVRGFSVYNDTLKDVEAQVRFVLRDGMHVVFETEQSFAQKAGERKYVEFTYQPQRVQEKRELKLSITLCHGDEQMFEKEISYFIYPSAMKQSPIDLCGKRAAYYGSEADYQTLLKIVPGLAKVDSLSKLAGYGILILGSYIDEEADAYRADLKAFVENGGAVVALEQLKFVPGELVLAKQSFFSAHMSDNSHPVLKGLCDDDFIYWNGTVVEQGPMDIARQSFIKPKTGDITLLLEGDKGDFGDGGDLWTPLFEYRYGKGTMLFNQLELMENIDHIPQAMVLLRNMIAYAASASCAGYQKTALIAEKGGTAEAFFKKALLEFDTIDAKNAHGYDILIVDPNYINAEEAMALQYRIKEGRQALVLPFDRSRAGIVSGVVGARVLSLPEKEYHVRGRFADVSIVDLYRYEKPGLSPRLVENTPIAYNTVDIIDGKEIFVSVPGTPWYDYHVNELTAEFSRFAVLNMARDERKPTYCYLAETSVGKKGRALVSQLVMEAWNEKDLRVYTRILSFMGAQVRGKVFDYVKADAENAVEYVMSLPAWEYRDYDTMEAYFSDPEYSLNNLGEGTYGWMKKLERSEVDGSMTLPDSGKGRHFITYFVDNVEDRCKGVHADITNAVLQVTSNADYKLWINGELVTRGANDAEITGVTLKQGLNVVCVSMMPTASGEDKKITMVFKDQNRQYIHNLRYQLTIDEVEPK